MDERPQSTSNVNVDIIGPIVREAARRPWVPVVCYALAALVAFYLHQNAQPIYRASFRIRYAEPKEDRQLPSFLAFTDINTAQQSTSRSSQEMVINSQKVVWNALSKAGKLPDGEETAPPPSWDRLHKSYSARIGVRLIEGTDIIDVSYQDGSSSNALLFIKSLLASYQEYDIETIEQDDRDKVAGIYDAIQQKEEARKKLQEDLEKAQQSERDLKQRIRRQRSIWDHATTLFAELQAARSSHSLADIERQAAVTQYEREIEDSPESKMYGPKSSYYLELEKTKAAIDLALKAQSLVDLNNIQQDIPDSIRDAQRKYLLESEYLQKVNKQVETLIGLSEGKLSHSDFSEEKILPPLFVEETIEGASSEQLESSVRRLEQEISQLEMALSTNDANYVKPESRIQVLDRPLTASGSSSAGTEFALAIAALGGTLLSAAALGFLSSRRRGFRSLEEMESAIPEGVVGLLPYIREQVTGPMMLQKGRRPAWDDRFRQLAYRLITFFGTDEKFRITVCSALPSEGKTTVAANLALTLGRTGRRVLIIDGNMRRPSCCISLGIKPESTGFYHLLTGQVPVSEAIHQTDFENTWLIPPGIRADDSTEHLSRSSLEPLLDTLSEQFDVIILDTPPALLVADAMITSHATDGLLLVHAVGTSSKNDLLRVLRQAKDADIPIIGVVANQRARSSFAAPRQDFGYVGQAASIYTKKGGGVADVPPEDSASES